MFEARVTVFTYCLLLFVYIKNGNGNQGYGFCSNTSRNSPFFPTQSIPLSVTFVKVCCSNPVCNNSSPGSGLWLL